MGMSHAKPGDQCNVNTVTYLSEDYAPGFDNYAPNPGMPHMPGRGGPPAPKEWPMFAPKGNTPLGLICAENSKEELTYLLN